VLKSFPQITISVGVAEYPSMVRDAEELMQIADEALFQVRTQGNKTCVAKPPEGFVADFEVGGEHA
jgi:GGDEF domain-containing protein